MPTTPSDGALAAGLIDHVRATRDAERLRVAFGLQPDLAAFAREDPDLIALRDELPMSADRG